MKNCIQFPVISKIRNAMKLLTLKNCTNIFTLNNIELGESVTGLQLSIH